MIKILWIAAAVILAWMPGAAARAPLADAPSARMWASLVDEPGSARVILFGGGRLNDTWILDTASRAWSPRDPGGAPMLTRLNCVGAAYDRRAGLMIVFLFQGAGQPGETWAYDPSQNTWQNLEPANPPLSRRFTNLVYDAESDRTLLIGGALSEDFSAPTNETWAYDYQANAWTLMQPPASPPPAYYLHTAYDEESDRVILWGGEPEPAERAVWSYDYNADRWSKTLYQAGPFLDSDGAMAYAAGVDRVFLYAGDQFWAYDQNTATWEEHTARAPGRRYAHALAYDEQSHRLVLFGGAGDDESTYFYDPRSRDWERLAPQPSRWVSVPAQGELLALHREGALAFFR